MFNLKKENTKEQNTPVLQLQRSENKVEVKKKNWIKITFFLLFEMILLAGAFSAGVNFSANKQLSNVTVNSVQSQAITSPIISQETSEKNSLGKTIISFANDSDHGLIYIKSETILTDPIVESIDGLRAITRIYTSNEDVSEPHELICLNQNDYKWTPLVTEPIDNSAGDKSILVSDNLFSFKKIPNTDNFLFVVDWERAGGELNVQKWSPTKSERVLYMYDKDNAGHELKNIATYTTAYPKIDSFSPEKRYVSLNFFGCWGCGSNKPPTLLLDTKNFTTKNIGRVSQFSWTSNGNYEYKDYVVIDCEYPQGWECTKEPDTLPLKTGKI